MPFQMPRHKALAVAAYTALMDGDGITAADAIAMLVQESDTRLVFLVAQVWIDRLAGLAAREGWSLMLATLTSTSRSIGVPGPTAELWAATTVTIRLEQPPDHWEQHYREAFVDNPDLARGMYALLELLVRARQRVLEAAVRKRTASLN